MKTSSGNTPLFSRDGALLSMLISVVTFFFMALSALNANAQTANTIQLENAKPGTPGWAITNPVSILDWRVFNPLVDRAPEIEGYASATSVNRGDTIKFYVNTPEPYYTLTIYRMGWYGGVGARQVWPTAAGTSVSLVGKKQIIPAPNPTTGLVECNWSESYSLTIPSTSDKTNWATGAYVAKLTAGVSGKQSYITFMVRDDASTSTYLFQSSVTTSQAYNPWGGKSLYAYNSKDGAQARKVSFNRPYGQERQLGVGWLFDWEIFMLRFLEREGYDVSYVTNLDVHENGSSLLAHKAFLSVGHDEYWSYQMKSAVQTAKDSGVHLGFFSANEVYWQIRLESSSTGQANRTMVAYKEAAQSSDPYAIDTNTANDKFITTRWRDLIPLFKVTDKIAQPENGLIGTMYHGDPVLGDIIVSDPTSWVYAGTGVSKGTNFGFLLGYETNAVFDNGFSPRGLQVVAVSPDPFGGSQVTLHTSASGSLTFATGSMNWSWGLDGLQWNWPMPTASGAFGSELYVSSAAQQVTRNVLARFALKPLAMPTSVVATAADRSVYLDWTPTSGASSYNIYRALTPSGSANVPYRTGISSSSFFDSGVVNGTTYYYQVVAINGAAESARSDEVSATPQANVAVQPPTNLEVGEANGKYADLSWTQSASAGITGNKIYRSTSSKGPFTLVATVAKSTSYRDKTPDKNIDYYYLVTAVKNVLESQPSNTAKLDR